MIEGLIIEYQVIPEGSSLVIIHITDEPVRTTEALAKGRILEKGRRRGKKRCRTNGETVQEREEDEMK